MKCEEDVMMKRLTDLEKALLNRVLELENRDINFRNVESNFKSAAWDKMKVSKMNGYPIKVVNARHNPESDLLKSIADREREELLYMDYLDGTSEARDLIKRIDVKVNVEG